MSALSLVDTHVHLWDPDRLAYPWHADAPALARAHGLAELDAARGDVTIERFVFVECDCAPEHAAAEVDWVSELARDDARIAGIVAAVRFEDPADRARLAALTANPLVKGVRRLLQGEADPAYCLRDDFVAGVRALAPLDLSFDICVYHPQLANAVELVRRCPDVRFVLDHLGKPGIAAGALDPWRADLRALAALPNTCCKLSGLVTEADHERWTQDDLAPYVAHALDCFGVERVMFGGDWPVSTLASTYPRWALTLDALLADLSAGDRERVFCGNAVRLYGLEA